MKLRCAGLLGVLLLPAAIAAAGPPPSAVVVQPMAAVVYVAALAIRYGLYYGIVVLLEVFGRTLAYGFEGGVGDLEGNKEGQR